MSNTNSINVSDMKRLLEAFNLHDLDSIMEFFADDAVFEMPRGLDPWGKRMLVKPKCGKA